eukprot:TRINITY_DN718_c0_g1_i1.p1 TRINITY_DN718_c0_g1~~TRINITY_DN718_c0_g1_i1.p1  ORF type:complete len:2019 (+),score=268.01 TRINITY_DN718_c0_g1_i1:1349-7405(+)
MQTSQHPCRAEQVRKSAIDLALLLDEKQEEQVLKDACLRLCQLFGEGIQNDRIQAILEANVVPRLVALLRSSKSRPVPTSVQLAALQVLGNVACGDDQQTQVVIDSDALPCLRALLSSSDRQIRKEVCWIVSNITESSHQVQDVLDADILPPLLKLLDNQDAACREDATWVLFNLSSNRVPGQISYLAEKNGVRALCNLLTCQKELDVLWKGCGTVAAVALKGLRNILVSGQLTASSDANGYNEMAALVAEAHGVERIETLTTHTSGDVRNRARLILERMFGTEPTNCDVSHKFSQLPPSALQHSASSQRSSPAGHSGCACEYSQHQSRHQLTQSAIPYQHTQGVHETKKSLGSSNGTPSTVAQFSSDFEEPKMSIAEKEAALFGVLGSTSGSSTDSDPEDDDSDSDLIPPPPAPCCCLLCTNSSPLAERRPRMKGIADDADPSKANGTNDDQLSRSICTFCSGCGRLGDGRAGLAAKLGRAVRLGHSHCLAILLSKMSWSQRAAATEAPALLHLGGGPPDLGSGSSLPAVVLAAQLGKPTCLGLLLRRCRPDLDVTHGKRRLTALAWAAHKGYLRCCQMLLESGAKPWTKCGDGVTALHLAASGGGHVAVCRLLLDKKAPVNAKSSKMQTPLCLAAQKGFSNVVQLLLERGANPNNEDEGKYTPLHLSASSGYIQTVEMLLRYGARVDATTRNEITPLHYAVQGGHSAVVEALIVAGAKVNCNKKPLLLIAADDGKRDIVNLLLDAEASVDCRANIRAMLNKETEICDYLTPLHLAASKNHHDVVEVLLNRGANVNELTLKSGWSALDFAVLNGHSESAVILLQHNAIVADTCKSIGRSNWTLVQHAASNGAKDVVRLLIRRLQEQRSAMVSSENADPSASTQPTPRPVSDGTIASEILTTNGLTNTTHVMSDCVHTCSACSKLRQSPHVTIPGNRIYRDHNADTAIGGQSRYDSEFLERNGRNPAYNSIPTDNEGRSHSSPRRRLAREDRQNTLRAREIKKREAEAREARVRLEEAIAQRSVSKLTEAISHVSRLVLHLAASVGSDSANDRSEKPESGDYADDTHSQSGIAHSPNQRNSSKCSNASLVSAPLAMEVGLGNEVRKARKILASLQAEEKRAREEREREAMDSKRDNAQQTVKKAITTALEGGDLRSLSRAVSRATRTVLDKDDPVIVEASSTISLLSNLEKRTVAVRAAVNSEDLEILSESLSETKALVKLVQSRGGMGAATRVFSGQDPSKILADAELALARLREKRMLEEVRQQEALNKEQEANDELFSAMKSEDIVRLEAALAQAHAALTSKESSLASTIETAKKVMAKRLKAERRKLRQAGNTNDPVRIETAASEAEEYGLNALRPDIETAKAHAKKLREQAAAVEDLKKAIIRSDVASLTSLRLTLNALGMFNEAEKARSELESLQRTIRARSLLDAAVRECQGALEFVSNLFEESCPAERVMQKLANWSWPDIQRLRDLSDRARQYGPSQCDLCESADELTQHLIDMGVRILEHCTKSNDARAIAATITGYEDRFVRVSRCNEFQNDSSLNAVNAAKHHLAHIQAVEQASIKAESAQVKVEYALATSRRSAARNRQSRSLVTAKLGNQGGAASSPVRSLHANECEFSNGPQIESRSSVSSELEVDDVLEGELVSDGPPSEMRTPGMRIGDGSRTNLDRKGQQEVYPSEDAQFQDSFELSPSISGGCSHFYLFKEGTTVCCARCGNHRSSSNPEWLARVKRRGTKVPDVVVELSRAKDGLPHLRQGNMARHFSHVNNPRDGAKRKSPNPLTVHAAVQGFDHGSLSLVRDSPRPTPIRTVANDTDANFMMQMLHQQANHQDVKPGNIHRSLRGAELRGARHMTHLTDAYRADVPTADTTHSPAIAIAAPVSPDYLQRTRPVSANLSHFREGGILAYGISRDNNLGLSPTHSSSGVPIGSIGTVDRQGLRVLSTPRMHDLPIPSEEVAEGSRDLGVDFANENFGFDIDAIVDEPILPTSKTVPRSDTTGDVSGMFASNTHSFFHR